MQIKRFEAKTMTAALKMVKDEFGLNAVILSARSLREHRGLLGMGRATGVEVTAASDTGASGAVSFGASGADRWASGRPANGDASTLRRGLFQSINDGLRSLAQRRHPVSPGDAASGPPAELTRAYQHLLTQEVNRDLAADLIGQIQRLPGFDQQPGLGDLQPLVQRVLHDMGVRTPAGAAQRDRPAVRVLVGPGGAGKTTTAIKLAAAHIKGAAGRAGMLLTLDDQRIGAIEQLRIFGSLLRVPVAVATSAAGVRETWDAASSMAWLIVDTPGVGLGETQRRSELRQMLEPLKTMEVHLVLNACTREKDLMRTIDAWRGFPADRLAFTRLDEAETCGHLLNLLVRSGLAISDLGTGPSIPEDLAGQPLEHLLDRIWPGREEVPARQEGSHRSLPAEPAAAEEEPRVANGNSELYHRSDCKWVRKIKPEHLIRFTSSAEAESRQFVACRNCHPQRDALAGAVARSGRRAAAGR